MSKARHRSRAGRFYFRVLLPIFVVLLAGTGALAVLVLRDQGGAGPGPSGPTAQPSPELEVPSFRFDVGSIQSVKTSARKIQGDAVRDVAKEIKRSLSQLYRNAFLDPEYWLVGAYPGVWDLFDKKAAGAAQKDLEILTLGVTAGATYDSVQPVSGTIDLEVLIDREGKPITAVAITEFTAEATMKDGQLTSIVSSGEYFLRPGPSYWLVYAYDVDRFDGGEA